MNDPTTPPAALPAAAPQAAPSAPAGSSGPQAELSAEEAATMTGWIKQDVASGKISPEQAAKAFAELGATPEQLAEDLRSDEAKALDFQFPTAKETDYTIHYGRPGEDLKMTAELKQFDTSARTWLSAAGFDRNLGNAVVNQIGKVAQTTQKMSAQELESYGLAEFAKLEQIHGDKLQDKLNAAGHMIVELDKQQPGLKNLLRSKGIGDNALIVNLLIQQAHHYHARNLRPPLG